MKVMEENFAQIITGIGEDLTREGLIDTPKVLAPLFLVIISLVMDVRSEGYFMVFPEKPSPYRQ